MNAGKDLYQRRDFNGAIRVFDIIASAADSADVMGNETLAPQVIDSVFRTALAWKQLGDITRAAHFYSLTVSLDPHHIQAALNYACLFHERGDLAHAIHSYK